jgi:hypothetical protein
MRRLLFAVVLIVLFLGMGLHVIAAPQAQEQRPVIAQPEQDAVVRGVVQIVGTATHPQFQRYELYYAPWPVPSDNAWIFIGPDAHYQQQPLGLLGTWDSRAVPDGAYALRVRVVKVDGNYHDSDPRKVTVANTGAPETPTPTPTQTPATTEPTALPTLAATPTVLVELPMQFTATPKPVTTTVSAAVTPSATPLLSSGSDAASSNGPGMGEIISSSRLLGTAKTAALYTAGAFGALALFFGTKALLVWLWNKMRP